MRTLIQMGAFRTIRAALVAGLSFCLFCSLLYAQTTPDGSNQCEVREGGARQSSGEVKKISALHPFPARVLEISGQAWFSVVPKAKTKRTEPPVEHQVKVNETLPLGAKVRTGPNSFLSLVLMDCSKVVLPSVAEVDLLEVPSGKVLVVAQRANKKFTQVSRTRYIARFDLKRGTGEFYVPSALPEAGKRSGPLRSPWKNELEVKTPGTLLGVRGTHFRVKWETQSDTFPLASGQLEVLEGLVSSQKTNAAGRAIAGNKNAQLLVAGMGTSLGPAVLRPPVALLPSPLADLDVEHSHLSVRPIEGAVAYKLQIAKDKGFLAILDQKVTPRSRIDLPPMPQGDYFLRLTALSDTGLEGLPGDMPWSVRTRKAEDNQVVIEKTGVRRRADGRFEITWPAVSTTKGAVPLAYRFDLALDPQFNSIVVSRENILSPGVTVEQVPVGRYFWRVQLQNFMMPHPKRPGYIGELDVP